MDSWKRFDETVLSKKKDFYSNFSLEHISNVDYRHAKRVFTSFSIKNLGDNYDLYVYSDTILLSDVSENFRHSCNEIYDLDPAHCLSRLALA